MKNKKSALTVRKITAAMNDVNLNNAISDEEEKIIAELCEFIKNCVLPQDRKTLLENLEKTIELRRRILYSDERITQACVQLYAVHPELVGTHIHALNGIEFN